MRDKLLALLYAFGVVFLLVNHSITLMCVTTLLLFMLAYTHFFSLLKRSIMAILMFNISISLGYIILSLFRDEPFLSFLILFNLRVFNLTFMTLLFSKSVNIPFLLSFFPTLSFLFTLSLSQIFSYKRSYENFMLSLKSRMIKKMNERNKKEFIATVFGYFFKKVLYDSEEKSLALKARGFFDKS